jgi:hypothetical protein
VIHPSLLLHVPLPCCCALLLLFCLHDLHTTILLLPTFKQDHDPNSNRIYASLFFILHLWKFTLLLCIVSVFSCLSDLHTTILLFELLLRKSMIQKVTGFMSLFFISPSLKDLFCTYELVPFLRP